MKAEFSLKKKSKKKLGLKTADIQLCGECNISKANKKDEAVVIVLTNDAIFFVHNQLLRFYSKKLLLANLDVKKNGDSLTLTDIKSNKQYSLSNFKSPLFQSGLINTLLKTPPISNEVPFLKKKTLFNETLISKAKHSIDSNTLAEKIVSKIDSKYIFTQFEFHSKISTGVSSYIFQGKINENPEMVAIKLFIKSDKSFDNFLQEFEILRLLKSGRLNSKYIVSIVGIVIEEYLMLVMEYFSKGSLYHLMKKEPDLFSLQFGLNLYSQIVQGLLTLHQLNPPLVHRDIKSLNILISNTYQIKITDFGLSCYITEGNEESRKGICGTLAYCDPELFMHIPYMISSDVYSLGILLWEIVQFSFTKTLNQPYSEYNINYDFQIIYKSVLGIRPSVLSDFPKVISDLYWLSVHPVPSERPPLFEIDLLISKFLSVKALLEEKCDPSIYKEWDKWTPPNESIFENIIQEKKEREAGENDLNENITISNENKPRRTLKKTNG